MPWEIVMSKFGGRTKIRLAETVVPSLACSTGISVARASRSTIALSWVGSKWGIKIRASPGSRGKARKRLMNASNPPAEAPMATMGKGAEGSATTVVLLCGAALRTVFLERGIENLFYCRGQYRDD